MTNNKIKLQPFDCMQHFYSTVQEPLIRCYIHFHGNINETALKTAVNLSMSAVPLISYCFDETDHCWRKHDFTADDIVHLTETHNEDGGVAKKLLLSSIDNTHEPQLKIYLVRNEKCDTLCVIMNHMVSDGGGFKEYLYLLCDLYSKCEKDVDYCTKQKPLIKRNLNQLLQNLSFKKKLSILFSKTNFNRQDPVMIMPIKGDPSNPIVVIRQIEKERFEKIQQFSKINYVSMNDTLLAAYMQALNLVTGCQDITVPCPVDLRKYKKDGQICGICNLTSNYVCQVHIDPGQLFKDTLKQVSVQMRAQKNSDTCLKGPMLYHMMFYMLPLNIVRKLFFKISPIPVTSYTNLGILDTTKFCFGSLTINDAFISTAVKNTPYFQLSISTFGGCCTMTSSLYGTEEDQKVVEGFLAQIENELVSLH